MRITGTSVLSGLTAVLLLAGSAACGGSGSSDGTAKAAPSATVATYGCLTPDQGRKGAFDLASSGGATLDAYYQDDSGHAKVALVFSHQNGGSLCDWVDYLGTFTKAGYGVLAFTTSGDVVADLTSAVQYAKGKGIAKVVLVGASKGGTASLVAGALPGPLPVAAVVSLSAPAQFGDGDATRAVGTSKLPEFFAAEEGDTAFADSAIALHKAAVSPDTQLKLYPGAHHGAVLLQDGALPDVQAFLSKYAPASG